MLRIDNKNMNYNGSCIVNDGIVANFSASVNEPNGNGYITINFEDLAVGKTHLAAAKLDLADFLDAIFSEVEVVQPEEVVEEEEE